MKSPLISVVCLALLGCGPPPPPKAKNAPAAPAAKVEHHNYVMHDGVKYGYQPLPTDDGIKAGIATPELVIVKFLGKKQDVYQLMFPDAGGYFSVMECKAPCGFLKFRTYYRENALKESFVANDPNIIGAMALQDAMEEKLEPAVFESEEQVWERGEYRSKKYSYTLWFDARGRRVMTRLNAASAGGPTPKS